MTANARFELITRWSQDIQKLETETLIQLLEVGSKVQKVFQMQDQLKVVGGGKTRRGKNRPDGAEGGDA